MPPELTQRPDLLDSTWASVLMGPAALLLAVLWLWSVRKRERQPAEGEELKRHGFSPLRLVLGVVFAAVATLAFWCGFQFLARFLTLGTTWPLWIPAILGGLGLEIIAWLYSLEKTLVTRARGRLMFGLRLAALVTLVLILVEPILSTLVDREINREVAILIDDSASMQLSDQRLSVSEMLDRATVFGVPALAERPPLAQWRQQLRLDRNRLSAAAAAFRAALPAPPAAQREQLGTTLAEVDEAIAGLADQLRATADDEAYARVSGDARNQVRALFSRLDEAVGRRLDEARDDNAETAAVALDAAIEQLDLIDNDWQAAADNFDTAWYQQLDDGDKTAVTDAAARPRLELAVQTLRQATAAPAEQTEADAPEAEGEPLATAFIEQLAERYNLRVHRFARTPGESLDVERLLDADLAGLELSALATSDGEAEAENDDSETPSTVDESTDETDPEDVESGGSTDVDAAALADASETALTDLSAALSEVLDNTSPEALAGVVVLSDGRHNGPVPTEDSLRRMAVQKSPLGAVAIGGRMGPVDASILSLTAPESIYLGDRVAVRAMVKLDGLRGREVKAVLRQGDEIVDEETLQVADVNQRSELRFVHLPDDKGIFDYSVELVPIEEELFDTNNRWDFKIAVTDDRTNVLLVDSYPRWEFRYLRNLFYGRDKSVHLQYVLMNPDQIKGLPEPKSVTASATRKFGEAEAHRLPTDEDEWRLFDVIIFGDIAPASIPADTWEIIARSVEERGALFVSVAGARYMPHAFSNVDFERLMPVTWEVSRGDQFESPEQSYRIELSNAGRVHPITLQSSSRAENARIWGGLPPMRWRFVPESVKDAAEVLAFAQPTDASGRATGSALDGSPDSVEAAIERLANQTAFEREHALITAQRVGLGKVVMLNFDQTWRLRYGVGDTLHHRLWGQIVRWGTGENLRSGNDFVRMGTDRLSYTPADDIKVVAKLLDPDRRPIVDAEVFAVVNRDGVAVARQRMSYRSSSNGLYETSFSELPGAGEYTVRIEGETIDPAIAADAELDFLETEIMVVNTRNPVELAELTADRDFLSRAAQITGGALVEPDGVAALVDLFGAPRETLTERRDVDLWDTWPLLLTFLGLVTTEWVVRRRSGLA